ncbi:MAG TPA: hypothetical protein VIF60_19960 [Burkholderiaceae bacterium]
MNQSLIKSSPKTVEKSTLRTEENPPSIEISHDFDFLMGRYTVRNRRLLKRLQGCQEWEEFDAINTARPLLRGAGNEDEFVTDHAGGYVGMSFRFFNPKTKQWSIYWASSKSGMLEPPVTGEFKDNVGLFSGADTLEGKAILVRFIWSRVHTPTPRWEQAFSNDGGLTWETNWVMEFRRAT